MNSIKDINTHCLAEFRKHWECLDDRNHQLWQCRPAEWKLNKCVYDNLVRYPISCIWGGIPDASCRNSRRRFPISPPTRPLFTSDQSRFLPTCASALVMVSPLFRGRRIPSNRVLESVRSRFDHVYLPMNQEWTTNYQIKNMTVSLQKILSRDLSRMSNHGHCDLLPTRVSSSLDNICRIKLSLS